MKVYLTQAVLPDTPKWDGTEWSKELDIAISTDYNYICTISGEVLEILSRDKVRGIIVPTSAEMKEGHVILGDMNSTETCSVVELYGTAVLDE